MKISDQEKIIEGLLTDYAMEELHDASSIALIEALLQQEGIYEQKFFDIQETLALLDEVEPDAEAQILDEPRTRSRGLPLAALGLAAALVVGFFLIGPLEDPAPATGGLELAALAERFATQAITESRVTSNVRRGGDVPWKESDKEFYTYIQSKKSN